MFAYQSNREGVKHFSHVNTSVGLCLITCAHKSRPMKKNYTFLPIYYSVQQKAALVLVEEKRVQNTQPNYSLLFLLKVAHISWRCVCKAFHKTLIFPHYVIRTTFSERSYPAMTTGSNVTLQLLVILTLAPIANMDRYTR